MIDIHNSTDTSVTFTCDLKEGDSLFLTYGGNKEAIHHNGYGRLTILQEGLAPSTIYRIEIHDKHGISASLCTFATCSRVGNLDEHIRTLEDTLANLRKKKEQLARPKSYQVVLTKDEIKDLIRLVGHYNVGNLILAKLQTAQEIG